jgi:hypothetical protein
MRVKMNIDVSNNWPLAVAPLPREKALQNEFTAPISSQNHQNTAILNNVSEIESNEFWAKGSFVDIYI